jgi:hypothetical protein
LAGVPITALARRAFSVSLVDLKRTETIYSYFKAEVKFKKRLVRRPFRRKPALDIVGPPDVDDPVLLA